MKFFTEEKVPLKSKKCFAWLPVYAWMEIKGKEAELGIVWLERYWKVDWYFENKNPMSERSYRNWTYESFKIAP